MCLNNNEKMATSIKNIDMPKAEIINEIVYQLYEQCSQYLPVEYSMLIRSKKKPEGNGIIIGIPKDDDDSITVCYVDDDKFNVISKSGPSYFTDAELKDLSNCLVCLEPGQFKYNFLERWFKYVIAKTGISKYRLKQKYWMSKLDEEEKDDPKDPDYIPEDESEEEEYEYISGDEEDEDDE